MYAIMNLITKRYIKKGAVIMANMNEKAGMQIDVQPLKTKEEIADMIEALGMNKPELQKRRDVLLFKLGITTGLRVGDIVALEVAEVRGKARFSITEGKTKKQRVVNLKHVMADIADYLELLPNDSVYLFPSRKGDKHISTTQAYRILTKAGDLIGNHSIGTHTMRKTFGYTYYNATHDIATLMTIFNHSAQSITLRYIGITDERITQSIDDISFF